MSDNEEDFSLGYEEENLKEIVDECEEFEFGPPDENKAKQLNTGNILLVLLIAIVVIIGTIVFVSKVNKSKKTDTNELNKAGAKYIPNIELNDKEIPFDFEELEENEIVYSEPTENTKKNVDEII